MILYVPSASAQRLSEALFRLSRPDASGSTRYRFGWRDDVHGNRWIAWNTEARSYIHADAALDEIREILQPYVDAGQLVAAEIDALAEVIDQHRGATLKLWDAVPSLFKAASKTHTELIDAGLLAEPVTP